MLGHTVLCSACSKAGRLVGFHATLHHHPHCLAGPGKVYLLIQAPAGAVPPPGFAVKRAFKLAMRKGVHVAFSLGGAELQRQQEQQQQLGVMAATPASACAAARGSGSGEAAERAAVWLQSKWVLRGMKVSSGSSAMC